MYIGKINFQGNNIKSVKSPLSQAINQLQSLQTVKNLQRNFDTVSITPVAQQNAEKDDLKIYQPNGNQMRSLFPDGISYVQAAPDAQLQMEIAPPSEKSDYTAQDALMNQYMKQYRIEGKIEGDTFVRDSNEPVRLMLPDMVSDEELSAYQQKLSQNGIGNEIDWRGVVDDFAQMGVGFDNAEKLESKVDYMASRYAVLKDRIDTQYTGDEHTSQMDTLNSTFNNAKDEMANTYAKEIGGFYEDMGQSGAAEDMKNSVLALIDEKTATFESHLANAGDYANIKSSEEQWLVQDDAYMAARLRESMAAAGQSEKTTSTKDIYSADDLMLAGVYAKNLTSQLHTAGDTWYNNTNDSALGTSLAAQNREVQSTLDQTDVSDKMANLMKNIFTPFMNKLMDKLDQRIDVQKNLVANSTWMSGTVRTDSIDRKAVYNAYQTAMGAGYTI
jgi:hypothetical protein